MQVNSFMLHSNSNSYISRASLISSFSFDLNLISNSNADMSSEDNVLMDYNTSLAFYLNKSNENENKNHEYEELITFMKQNSTHTNNTLISLKTRRTEDINIPQEILKMKNFTFKTKF